MRTFHPLPLILCLPLSLLACEGEDRVMAPTTVEFAPTGESDLGKSTGKDDFGTPGPGNGETPGPGLGGDTVEVDDLVAPPDEEDVGEEPIPVEPDIEEPAADVGKPGKPDAGPKDEPDTGWVPDWVENADPSVKGCLESFPAICDKVAECGETQPILGLLGGFCPTLFDAINPILTLGCDQVGNLVNQAVPGGIPFVGELGDLLPKLIKGCIENFQCTPEYLQEFGATIQDIIAMFQQGQGGQSGGDLTDALPALLALAEKCGGLGVIFPDLPFFGE